MCYKRILWAQAFSFQPPPFSLFTRAILRYTSLFMRSSCVLHDSRRAHKNCTVHYSCSKLTAEGLCLAIRTYECFSPSLCNCSVWQLHFRSRSSIRARSSSRSSVSAYSTQLSHNQIFAHKRTLRGEEPFPIPWRPPLVKADDTLVVLCASGLHCIFLFTYSVDVIREYAYLHTDTCTIRSEKINVEKMKLYEIKL